MKIDRLALEEQDLNAVGGTDGLIESAIEFDKSIKWLESCVCLGSKKHEALQTINQFMHIFLSDVFDNNVNDDKDIEQMFKDYLHYDGKSGNAIED